MTYHMPHGAFWVATLVAWTMMLLGTGVAAAGVFGMAVATVELRRRGSTRFGASRSIL